MNSETKPSAQTPAGIALQERWDLSAETAAWFPSVVPSAVFIMRFENLARISVEKFFACFQTPLSLGGQRCAVKIELADLLKPDLQLFQLGVLFLEFCVGELVGCSLLGNLSLEASAFPEEFSVLIISVGLEPGDDLFLLDMIESQGLQDDGVAAHGGDLVLQHFQAPGMIVALGEKADAIL